MKRESGFSLAMASQPFCEGCEELFVMMMTQVFHGWRDDLDKRWPGKERALIQVKI